MSNRAKLFIPAVFFLVMAGLLLYGLGRNPNSVPSAMIYRPVPQFSLPDLNDVSVQHTADEIKGGIYLINFWATWCPPCYAEHPFLLEISQREKGVTFVGVSYKDPDQQAARDFLTQRGNPFKFVAVDLDGRTGIDFGVAGPPETFLVDASGTIRYRHVGAIDNRVWKETFEPLIAQLRQ